MTKTNIEHCCHHEKQCITLVPIFNHLEQEQMAEIMSTVQSASYKKGDIIYSAGDKADTLYIVNKGKVKIYRLSETGKEQLIRFLNPGDFTGELALFKESQREAFAEAVVDTSVCLIRRADLQQFLIKYPTIAIKILNEFAKRLDSSEKQATWIATEKVETRIANFLVECTKIENRLQFTLPMSKKDLASYLGTTPETISRKITEFEQKGIIKQISSRKIKVLDLDELLLI